MEYRIKEKSFIARIAAWKLNASKVAIVLGKTIHLHNASKEELIANQRWFRHELTHVRQFQQNGYILFILKYLFESLKNGYENNKYEIEARARENLPDVRTIGLPDFFSTFDTH